MSLHIHPGRTSESHQSRGGFSIVELLVVVGIIAVLISILLPSLGRARAASRNLNCLSNLRQLQLNYQAYLIANEGKSLVYPASEPSFWMAVLTSDTFTKVGSCPEANELPTGGAGTAHRLWGPNWNRTGSYCFNGFLYRNDATPNPIGFFGAEVGTAASYYSLPANNAEDIPTFTDGVWVDAWPKSTDAVPTTSAQMNTGSTAWGNEMLRVCTNRHGRTTNVVFLDGHAETIKLERLWQLKWSPNFQPTVVKISVQ